MRCVRVFFTKSGRIRYTSHLDLVRAMQRAVRRSGIAVKYSEGFNPHMQMTFALPLSLGMESCCEAMDIKVEDETTDEEIVSRLNPVMPEGLHVTSAAEPKMKLGAIRWGEFEISIYFPDDFELRAEKMRERLEQPQLTAVKETKKSTKVLNLKEYIHSIKVAAGEDCVKVSAVLPAGGENNINPALLAQALCGATYMKADYTRILRKRLMNEEFNDFC